MPGSCTSPRATSRRCRRRRRRNTPAASGEIDRAGRLAGRRASDSSAKTTRSAGCSASGRRRPRPRRPNARRARSEPGRPVVRRRRAAAGPVRAASRQTGTRRVAPGTAGARACSTCAGWPRWRACACWPRSRRSTRSRQCDHRGLRLAAQPLARISRRGRPGRRLRDADPRCRRRHRPLGRLGRRASGSRSTSTTRTATTAGTPTSSRVAVAAGRARPQGRRDRLRRAQPARRPGRTSTTSSCSRAEPIDPDAVPERRPGQACWRHFRRRPRVQ